MATIAEGMIGIRAQVQGFSQAMGQAASSVNLFFKRTGSSMAQLGRQTLAAADLQMRGVRAQVGRIDELHRAQFALTAKHMQNLARLHKKTLRDRLDAEMKAADERLRKQDQTLRKGVAAQQRAAQQVQAQTRARQLAEAGISTGAVGALEAHRGRAAAPSYPLTLRFVEALKSKMTAASVVLVGLRQGFMKFVAFLAYGFKKAGVFLWAFIKQAMKGFQMMFSFVLKWAKRAAIALAVMGVAIVGVAVKSFFAFSRFEAKLRNVWTLMANVTEKQLQRMGEAVRNLAVVFGHTTSDLLDAMFDIVSAGYRGREALEVLRVAAMGAVAGVTSTKDAASALVTALKTFRLSARDSMRAMDILFKTQELGRTTFQQLSEFMSTFAPVAEAAGLSLEEFGALVSSATLALAKTDITMTALAQGMRAIAAPTRDSQKAMAEMGIVTTDLEGHMLNIVSVMKQFVGLTPKALRPLVPSFRASRGIIAVARSIDTLRAHLIAISSASGATTSASGATIRAFNKVFDSLESRMKRARRALTTAFEYIGEGLRPLSVAVLERVGDMARAFMNWAKANRELIASGAMELLVNITAFFKALSDKRVGGAAKTLFQSLISGISELFTGLKRGLLLVAIGIKELVRTYYMLMAKLSGTKFGRKQFGFTRRERIAYLRSTWAQEQDIAKLIAEAEAPSPSLGRGLVSLLGIQKGFARAKRYMLEYFQWRREERKVEEDRLRAKELYEAQMKAQDVLAQERQTDDYIWLQHHFQKFGLAYSEHYADILEKAKKWADKVKEIEEERLQDARSFYEDMRDIRREETKLSQADEERLLKFERGLRRGRVGKFGGRAFQAPLYGKALEEKVEAERERLLKLKLLRERMAEASAREKEAEALYKAGEFEKARDLERIALEERLAVLREGRGVLTAKQLRSVAELVKTTHTKLQKTYIREREAAEAHGKAVETWAWKLQENFRLVELYTARLAARISDPKLLAALRQLAARAKEFRDAMERGEAGLKPWAAAEGGDEGMQHGGFVRGRGGVDRVLRRLTSGEFVVNAAQARRHTATLQRINAGTYEQHTNATLSFPNVTQVNSGVVRGQIAPELRRMQRLGLVGSRIGG